MTGRGARGRSGMLRVAALVVAIAVVAPEGARAQPPDVNDETAPSGLRLEGLVDAGFRWRSVGGNDDKYREDLNYRTGPRLFNLDLDLTPADGSGPIDLARVYAYGLGDPYEQLGFALRRVDRFNLRFRRNTSTYFYRDIILPHAEADPSKSNAGDFHTFNFDRQRDQLDFDLHVAPRTTAFFRFNRQTRQGDSTTTLDISRDEFELDQPLREIKDDYTVGVRTALGAVSFYVDHTYRDYENRRRLFLPGASVGENVDDPTEVFFYEQLLPFDFTMPQTTVKVHARPTARLRVTGGVIHGTLSGRFDHEETARGQSFEGLPFDTLTSGDGDLERRTTLVDVDLSYDLTARVALIGGIRAGQLDQTGSLTHVEPEPRHVTTGSDISTLIGEVGAQVVPATGLTLNGGLRLEQRDTVLATDDVETDRVETDRTTFFANGTFRRSTRWSLFAEYERGTYDNPFTLVAPTTLGRTKLRARFRPTPELTVTGVLHDRRLENDLARPTLGPDVPRSTLDGPASEPARLDTTDLTLHAAYARGATSVFGGYTRREARNEVVNQVLTSPGFLGGQMFDVVAAYRSDLDRVFAGTWLDVSERLGIGAELSQHHNRGSFGLDWRQYRVSSEVRSPAGYLLRLSYQYNDLDEVDFVWDDYHAHMVTVSVGYRFR